MALKKGPLPLCLFTLHQKRVFPIFYTCYTKILVAESNLNFCFVWKFASAWKSISHCKLFEVIWFHIVLCLHIKVVKGPSWHIFLLCFEKHMTCSRVVHQLSNKTMQKISAKASKSGSATSLKKGGRKMAALFVFLHIHTCSQPHTKKELDSFYNTIELIKVLCNIIKVFSDHCVMLRITYCLGLTMKQHQMK